LVEKKSQPCDGRLSEANSKSLTALNSAFAFQSQPLVDALRVQRLVRTGLPLALAVAVAPLAYGEARE
jgi:hypothetical protein